MERIVALFCALLFLCPHTASAKAPYKKKYLTTIACQTWHAAHAIDTANIGHRGYRRTIDASIKDGRCFTAAVTIDDIQAEPTCLGVTAVSGLTFPGNPSLVDIYNTLAWQDFNKTEKAIVYVPAYYWSRGVERDTCLVP